MASKTSEAQRNALVLRAEEIGLDAAIAHECRSEEQQDAMLDIQKQVGFEKLVYESVSKKSPQKPTRDYDAAQQKLDDLLEYARSLGDKDAWVLLKQVELLKASSHRNAYRSRFKDKVGESLNTTKTSKTKIEALTTSMMQYFDAYEVIQKDYAILNDFTLYEDGEELHRVDPNESTGRDF